MNVVMSSEGQFVEVQGTGEHGTFDRARARRAARPRREGMRELDAAQQRALGALTAARRPAARDAQRGQASRAASALRGARHRRARPRRRRARRVAGEDALEVFETFEENALAKARYFSRAARACPTFADDSGLVVVALGGVPGVRSKRWSGRDGSRRRRRSTTRTTGCCSSALRGRRRIAARATCARRRTSTARASSCGAARCRARSWTMRAGSDGFGYDPYFVSDELGTTFGEASREEKER